MATLQTFTTMSSSSSPSSLSRRTSANLQAPTNSRRSAQPTIPKPITKINMETLRLREANPRHATQFDHHEDEVLIPQLYAIAEAAADRAEMHAIIGQQRDNWGHLLLNSINSIALSASIMAGAASALPTASLALKLSSTILFASATAMMAATNKIQPSQLAEEQRNAHRLFRQIEKSIHTTLATRAPNQADVHYAMERVLALDKAYPLPLLPGMLEKFPKTVKPAVWWPKLQNPRSKYFTASSKEHNGWSKELEDEMKGVDSVLKKRDTKEYVHMAEVILRVNKILAVLGPLSAGMATVGAGLIGFSGLGQWPAVVAMTGGAVAAAVNTLEHGGQVGMVFEMFRNCAGYYLQMEEEIEFNLGEKEVERRENGEVFAIKMALKLGRSMSEMKKLGLSCGEGEEEDGGKNAGKLF